MLYLCNLTQTLVMAITGGAAQVNKILMLYVVSEVFMFSFLSESSKKWQEKADLLTRLESQVKRMKENFDSKERLLLEERDKAAEAHKYATISIINLFK